MKAKEIIFTIFITLIVCVLLGLNYFSNKFILHADNVYQVYLDSEVIGYINDADEFYDIIDNKQEEIKKRYSVDTVYPPEGLKIVNTNMYNVELSSAAEVYDKISLLSSFTIEGYTINIKDENGKKLHTLNILDKTVFDEAVEKFILAFISQEEYYNYMNNVQPEIETTGKIIEFMYFEQTISLKKGYIPVDQEIYTDSAELSQALLFGEDKDIKTYEVKKGDTIASIASANKLNSEEFLIANPNYQSENSLLAIGDTVNITLINPIISFAYDAYEVKDTEIAYEKKIVYDTSKATNYEEITTAGVTGITRVSSRYAVINGETQGGVEIVSSQEITKKIDQVTTKGGYKTYRYTGSYYDTGLEWGWPTNVPYVITSTYNYRWGTFHDGLDISGTGFGSPIYAVLDGVVYFAGWASLNNKCGEGGGNCVIIRHENDMYTIYAHMANDTITVKEGDTVARGQVIGGMGSTGYSTGTHLHFGVWQGACFARGSYSINPMALYQ